MIKEEIVQPTFIIHKCDFAPYELVSAVLCSHWAPGKIAYNFVTAGDYEHCVRVRDQLDDA